ncbi:MAG TPA: hypothetical protein VGP47_10390 [Parachlamydiaceae bacterium]|nr:hypothetical protein [Parachlamydiaceae bacterium]
MLDNCNINFRPAYTSEEIALPNDFPKSFPIDNKIKFLKKVLEVFDPQSIEGLEHEIRASQEFLPNTFYSGGTKHYYIQRLIDPYDVQFKDGKVQIDLIDSFKFKKQSLSIQKILVTAMERLAKELNWNNTTHKISCNTIEYRFYKKECEPLAWHSDERLSIPSEHSFIILLSNPQDKETGWSGGDLLYTSARDFKHEDLDDNEFEKTLPFYQKGALLNEPNSEIWQMQYTQNDGILFGNRGMNHKVTAMYPLNCNGRRLILTLFDFGEANKIETEDAIEEQIFNSNDTCPIQ